jgi:hypothetical protein
VVLQRHPDLDRLPSCWGVVLEKDRVGGFQRAVEILEVPTEMTSVRAQCEYMQMAVQ